MLQNNISQCLKDKDMATLKNLLTSAEPVEIFNIFPDLSDKEQVIVFRLLPKDDALFVFEELDTEDQHNLLDSFTDTQKIEFINELAPDDRVRLLDELPAAVAKRIISGLSKTEREMTDLLMGYEPQTAGRLMTPEYVRISKDLTAAAALEKVKQNAKEKETIYTIYVTDEKRKLEGTLSLRDLLIATPEAIIADIMDKISITVSTDTDQEEVARLLQKLDWLAVPVIDRQGLLVGIVTIDDALDILEDEATEDIMTQAGLMAGKETHRSEALIHGNLFTIWKVRLPFLVITLLAGILSGSVISGFEDVLESVAAVAFFIPMIMDMGGTVGTQSSTVFARGVVLGHINTKAFFKHFTKEIGVGFTIGVITGLCAGTIAFVWQREPMLGLAVGLALTITVTLASSLGFLVPFVLLKLNVDQAAGSSPIITSLKDISGLVVYFLLASLLLGHLM